MTRSLRAGVLVAFLAAALTAQFPSNSPNASLTINGVSTGSTSPLQAIMRAWSTSVVEMNGIPNAPYAVVFGQPGSSNVPGLGNVAIPLYSTMWALTAGVLDSTGHDEFGLRFDNVPAALLGNFQAIMVDSTTSSGYRLSAPFQVALNPTPLTQFWGVEVKTSGTIEAIGTNSVTVYGMSYNVTAQTVFTNTTSLSALSVGQWVEINGIQVSSGCNALEIALEDWSPQTTIMAPIDSVGATGFTLMGVVAHVLPTTQYTAVSGPLSFLDLGRGMIVNVTGIDVGGVFQASHVEEEIEIEIEEPAPPPPPPYWFCG